MNLLLVVCIVGLLGSTLAHSEGGGASDKLKVFAVGTTPRTSDGLTRFLRSASLFGFDVKTIGIGAGTQIKADIIKNELEALCSSESGHSDDMLYMFVDAQDSLLVGSPIEIVDSFKRLKADIIFSADTRIWPDESLAGSYPTPTTDDYPFLCSAAFIGKRKAICELFSSHVHDVEDDQVFFTQLYLDNAVRAKYNIKLDGRGEIFQAMHGAADDVVIKYLGAHSFVVNTRFETNPKVIVANGARVEVNRLSDYVPDGWSTSAGCQSCEENRISLEGKEVDELPLVVVAVFIEEPTPFLPTMLRRIVHFHYPMKRIVLAIHNAIPYHAPNVTDFLASSIVAEYHAVELLISDGVSTEGDVRNQVLDLCDRYKCEYIFQLDSVAHIHNPGTLKNLIEQNRPIIAPVLRRQDEMYTNFWGSVGDDGFYSRSGDYMDIANDVKRGVWNVPCIMNAVLIRADMIDTVRNGWFSNDVDADLALCNFLRKKGVFMYADNQNYYGHLVNPDNYNLDHYRPELWELNTNRIEWEELYIDRPYWSIAAKKEGKEMTPLDYETHCSDVFVYPLMTPTFCRHLVDELEHYGKWSGGKNDDPRLKSGYESVPTVDIHMRQIDYHNEWLQILKRYISPLAKFSFLGYEPQSRATMAFVVRYHPNEQNHLRGHFDSSTWTSVIPLTRQGVDFEGGGTRFVRLNCSVVEQPLGHSIIFPGRLTHWHEGLPVTKGVRYISVTFADP